MSDLSGVSDAEDLAKEDDKDSDFNIEDVRNEIYTDDSFDDLPEEDEVPSEGIAETLDGTGENIEESTCAREDEGDGCILPGGHRFDKKIVCIKYPGNVINPDKAIETLGGLAAITTAVDTPNRRLELRFRPDDGYSKPACGDRYNAIGFLLRVRVKKSRIEKVDGKGTSKVNTTVESVEVLSPVQSNSNTCNSATEDRDDSSKRNDRVDLSVYEKTDNQDKNGDSIEEQSVTELTQQIEKCTVDAEQDKDVCQQSPLDSSNTSKDTQKNYLKHSKDAMPTFDRNKYEDLSRDDDYQLPKLKVLGRVDTEFKFTSLCDFQYLPLTLTKANPKVLECIYDSIYPTGIPPYSWLKKEVPYFLPPAAFSRMDSVQQYIPKTEADSLTENPMGKNRKRIVTGFSSFISFNSTEVPTSPPSGIENAMKIKFLQTTHVDKLRQLFEDRPIWSRNALMYETKFTHEQLKILLPSVAYHFVNGPWRVMWVKLGYDPRIDTSTRKYQTLDYRLRAMHGLGSTVTCKRNYADYTLPYKSTTGTKQKAAVLTATLSQEQNQKKVLKMSENVYIYREGVIPPSRQMFYQYCDILTDEIQEMLAKLPDPAPGAKCDEKRGWLPGGFDVQCREIINKQVRAVLRKKMNIPADHPTSLPRKRRYSRMARLNKLKNKRRKKERNDDLDKPGPSTRRS